MGHFWRVWGIAEWCGYCCEWGLERSGSYRTVVHIGQWCIWDSDIDNGTPQAKVNTFRIVLDVIYMHVHNVHAFHMDI